MHMQGVLVYGRRFRTINVLDLVTRECLAIAVDTSLPSHQVTRIFDQLISWHGASISSWKLSSCMFIRAAMPKRLAVLDSLQTVRL